jgi:hypothetical protein
MPVAGVTRSGGAAMESRLRTAEPADNGVKPLYKEATAP